MKPNINPAIIPTKCAVFAIFPKPNTLKIPVKPINNQMNINKYRASGKLYLPLLPSSSIIKQYPSRP